MRRAVQCLHVTRHWQDSIAPADAIVAFSELGRGDCPVATRTFAINFVMEGTERYEFGGRVSQVEAGELLLVEPGATGRVSLPGGGTTRGLSIYLPAPAADSSVHSSASLDPDLIGQFRFRASASPFGRTLLAARKHLAAGRSLDEEACLALVTAAAAEFEMAQSGLVRDMASIEARKPSTRRDLLQRVHRARDYLLSHPGRAVSLRELARFAGMSQFHLTRTFAAVFGLPPLRFHSAARLAAAERALRSGKVSTGEAAALFGFSDRSSFSRAFRRERGVYPARIARDHPSEGEGDPKDTLMP
jgi:AraC-like DNA-binding protein